MFILRRIAVVAAGTGMLAILPAIDAHACDDDRFPCPVVSSEAVLQETADTPLKPAPLVQQRKKSTEPGAANRKGQPTGASDNKPQPKLARDPRATTATGVKSNKAAVRPTFAAQPPTVPLSATPKIPQPITSVADDQSADTETSSAVVAAATTVWPAVSNPDVATMAEEKSSAGAVPSSAGQVLDTSEVRQFEQADVAPTVLKWISYVLIFFSVAICASAAIWFAMRLLPRKAGQAAAASVRTSS
jgi:hypothetical protein